MTQESLRNKTIKGTAWSAVDAILGKGVSFLVGIILARLLSPDEYGLIGICLIFNSVLNAIVDSGFGNALIRKENADDKDYNTMFYTNLGISVILYVLLYLSSFYIAEFFQRSELESLIKVTGLVLVFNSFSLVQGAILMRKLDFKSKTKASIISSLISGLFGISCAIVGLGVWALVIQIVSRSLFNSLCLWFNNNWFPSRQFSIKSLRYMWGFGSKMLLAGLLNNLWNQLTNVVVGKFYTPYSLGQYTKAGEYASLFSENINTIVQRVSYPVLCSIKEDKEKLILNYRKITKVTMFISANFMLILAAISEPLLYCLIGPQWGEAAYYLPFLCISMSLYPLHSLNLNLLQVEGRSDLFLYLDIVKKIIGILPLMIGVYINITWMLITSIFTGILCFFLNSYYTGKNGYTSLQQLKDVSQSYLLGLFLAILIFPLKYMHMSEWFILIIQLTVVALVGILICEYYKIPEYKELKYACRILVKKQ